ncbi:MAG: ATP-dependent RNA helicase HrpA [Yaniella sp.]|uniref:ATP-dependent RNA helicase HrpA n=1 Tax=Yaniella sp. TaxID=2773929 RepID=UPI003F9AA38E
MSKASSVDLSAISFPEELPVSLHRGQIMEQLAQHQVVIVAGETGSGKTTQLPKMCLAMGLADTGMIGHTQPRRIAARSVAERVADELGQDIGSTVGYQVRFTSEVSADTRLKVMTDGILLAEIQHDPNLSKYSVIIIDEAHERSLNIDFLLGYLKRLLGKRDDLKVIITSATIDPESFAEHFADANGRPAPIVEVSGRTYPVEVRYRPLAQEQLADDPDDDADDMEEARDPLDAIADAVEELGAEEPGDMLIFFPGEREIRDAAEVLGTRLARHPRLAKADILPLFGRLSLQDQQRVFRPGNNRRIVLATNVAETSLTVPGIKYVIDTGTARISRYSQRTKVQRLPIERISQASAQQRAGRAGRTSPGIAIRLYSEEDFEARPEFTDPEILRTSLASVILHMASTNIITTATELEDFPFLQPPEHKQITDGVTLLTELGALNSGNPTRVRGRGGKWVTRTFKAGTITPVGRRLARLPVAPRLARMILASEEHDVVPELLVLTAGLTVQDPRERPEEHRGAADELHARFTDDKSDFSALLNLWDYLHEQQRELSGNQFRKLCRREFINYLRVREWQDLVRQLRQIAREVGIKLPSNASIDAVKHHDGVHKALLTGLLAHIGAWDERRKNYQGARGSRFAVFPGSGLFKKRHDFVMASELVETSRLWARQVATVEPAWIEAAAGSLAKVNTSDPYWSRRNGTAMAKQRVTVYGVTIVTDRPVRYYNVDEGAARQMFIHHALIEGEWNTRHHFFKRNLQRVAEVQELETRMRRRDLLVSEDVLFAFYDARIPEHIVSQRHFDAWWRKARHENPQLLDLDPTQLMADAAQDVDVHQFPDVFIHPTPTGDVQLPLHYEFTPVAAIGADASGTGQPVGPRTDGVTVTIPVALLHQVEQTRFDWLIPGLRTELVTALIRGLPKPIRKHLVPAPDTAQAAVEALSSTADPATDDFYAALATFLRRTKHQYIKPEDWTVTKLPPHLRFTYQVVDDRGAIVGTDDNLGRLQRDLAGKNQTALAASLTDAAHAKGVTLPGRKNTSGQRAQKGKQQKPQQSTKQHSPVAAESSSSFTPRTGITRWDFGDIPATVQTAIWTGSANQNVTGYPALQAEDGKTPSAALVVMRTQGEQQAVHRSGIIALLQAELPDPQRYILDHLSAEEKLAFAQSPYPTSAALVADCTRTAIDALLPEELPLTQQAYQHLAQTVQEDLIDTTFKVTTVVAKILNLSRDVDRRIRKIRSLSLAAAASDLRTHHDQLVGGHFVSKTGWAHLRHVPRYLEGISLRLDKLDAGGALQRDGLNMQVVQTLEKEYEDLKHQAPTGVPQPAAISEIFWQLQELRISLFAQELGTATSVSEKRLRQTMKAAAAQLA